MKNLNIRSAFVLLLFAVASSSCQKDDKPKDELKAPVSQNQFFKENVSFVDARVRSLNLNEYVREVILVNHSKLNMMPSSLIFKDTYFVDNGSFSDLKANDGIYTSSDKFEYNRVVTYDENSTVSVMSEIVVDRTFKYKDELKNLYAIKLNPSERKNIGVNGNGAVNKVSFVSVECDIEFGTNGCRAERWGWCNSCCYTISNCSKITFSLW